MNISQQMAESAEFISSCPECDGRFYHNMKSTITMPESAKVSINLMTAADLRVQTEILVGVPNEFQIRKYSVPSQWSIMELTQARMRGNRAKSCMIRRGDCGKKDKRAIYDRLHRIMIDSKNLSLGATAANPCFPRDAVWDEQVRSFVKTRMQVENDGYLHKTEYTGGINTMSTALSTYRDDYTGLPCGSMLEFYCDHSAADSPECYRKNCAFKLHTAANSNVSKPVEGLGPLEYYCRINGVKGKAFLDTGVLNLPVNLDGRTSSVFVSKDYVKATGLKTMPLHSKATYDRPASFDITVANDEVMKCNEMIKGAKMRLGKHTECVDLFVLPSNQFDIILGRQWFKLRKPVVNHKDDSLVFDSKRSNGTSREIIVPHAGMHLHFASRYSTIDASGNSRVTTGDSNDTDLHFTFAHFWHMYTHSREYLVDKSPVYMLRLNVKHVLGDDVHLPHLSDDSDQFDPPDDTFLGNSSLDKEMHVDQSIPGWQHKGHIENMNHPLKERPMQTDLDKVMWDEFGDDGKNIMPQEIPDFDDKAVPNIERLIPVMTGHEHDYPCHTPRKLDKLQQEELLTQLQYYLKKGWIRPSSSPYGACILFVRKKNGKFRMCIDYRSLNKITVKDKYPLPDAESVIEQMQGAKYFSQLDLAHGYHQCVLQPEDIEKTTFRTMFGAYEWKVMTFGFSNAVPAFVRLMNNTLHKQLGKCCMVFIDDIVIYSKTREQHVIDCRNVMQSIADAGLYVNWAKSLFDVEQVQYLGLNISRHGITPFADKVETVRNWERPTTIYHLRSFLGAVGYYRKFIYNFSNIARPLTDLTKSNVNRDKAVSDNLTMTKWGRKQKTERIGKQEWNDDCEAAFLQLKEALCSHPVLKLPDPSLPYEIMTDASKKAVGAVLMQRDENGELHPIAFYSAKHTDAESNYPVHEFELLAIFKSLKQWRHLLIGSKISLYTDHKPLTHLLSQEKLSPRQERWITYLADYDVDILAVSGTSNKVSDCLSRYNYDGLTNLVDDIKKEFVNSVHTGYSSIAMSYAINGFEAVSQLQPSTVTFEDSDLSNDDCNLEVVGPTSFLGGTQATFASISVDQIRQSLQDAYSSDPLAKLVIAGKHAYSDLKLQNNVIVRIDRDGNSQLYIPANAIITNSQLRTEHPVEGDILRPTCSLREELLRQVHNNGHIGAGKMVHMMVKSFYWPKMRLSVIDFVRGCKKCQMNKSRTHKEYGKLRSLELPVRRWARINMDFIVAMPTTSKGYDAIMVVIDAYSKRAHFIPTHSTATAQQTAQLFYEHIWKLHGLPVKIISDRDSKFTSNFWVSLMKLLGTEIAMSTPFHPQTDGLVERLNLTLKEMLRAFSDNARLHWDTFLPAAEYVYNSTYQSSTKDTPFMIDTNQQPLDTHNIAVQKIIENVSESDLETAFNYDDLSTQFIRDWNDNLMLARENLKDAQERMEKYYNRARSDIEQQAFQVGDNVYLDGTHINVPDVKGKHGARKALDKRRLGPYEIEAVKGDRHAFKLKLPEFQKFHPVQPVSRLEKVVESAEFPDAHANVPYLPVIIDDVEEYEIESILRHKTVRGNRMYYVKYLGYDEYDWLSRSDLKHAQELLKQYEIRHKLVGAPVRRSARVNQ
jgi:transposase InsO family protein